MCLPQPAQAWTSLARAAALQSWHHRAGANPLGLKRWRHLSESLQQVCGRQGFLFLEIIGSDVDEAIVRFQSEHPPEKMEAAPLSLVGILLGILCFVGLWVWGCKAEIELQSLVEEEGCMVRTLH